MGNQREDEEEAGVIYHEEDPLKPPEDLPEDEPNTASSDGNDKRRNRLLWGGGIVLIAVLVVSIVLAVVFGTRGESQQDTTGSTNQEATQTAPTTDPASTNQTAVIDVDNSTSQYLFYVSVADLASNATEDDVISAVVDTFQASFSTEALQLDEPIVLLNITAREYYSDETLSTDFPYRRLQQSNQTTDAVTRTFAVQMTTETNGAEGEEEWSSPAVPDLLQSESFRSRWNEELLISSSAVYLTIQAVQGVTRVRAADDSPDHPLPPPECLSILQTNRWCTKNIETYTWTTLWNQTYWGFELLIMPQNQTSDVLQWCLDRLDHNSCPFVTTNRTTTQELVLDESTVYHGVEPLFPCAWARDDKCKYIMNALDPVLSNRTRAILEEQFRTCQGRALHLLRSSVNVTTFPVARLRQRFALAVLDCQSYNTSQHWKNTRKDLITAQHECNWYNREDDEELTDVRGGLFSATPRGGNDLKASSAQL
eukprot:Sro153_g069810.2  (482) ;mRNA; f:87767-89292